MCSRESQLSVQLILTNCPEDLRPADTEGQEEGANSAVVRGGLGSHRRGKNFTHTKGLKSEVGESQPAERETS